MDEARLREIFAGEEAWIVGGAVRDDLLGRPVVDVDVACRDPRAAARRFAQRFGGAPFPLSERHGAWRVVEAGSDETVDFTPLPHAIEDDLATRDFTLNAIAVPVGGGEACDPYDGRGDLERRTLRAVTDGIFAADPVRLLRAVRLEAELDLHLDEHTEQLLHESASLVTQPAGERILGELRRLPLSGFRRLDGPLDALDDPDFRLVAVFGERLTSLPISNDLRRYARVLLRARPPEDPSPRGIHRFRRETEPWALDALAFVGSWELAGLVEEARDADPPEPLLRGDELGLAPGPEIGRILAAIDEEHAAGTIATHDEALALARRLSRQAQS